MSPYLTDTGLVIPAQMKPNSNLLSIDAYITAQCNRRCTYCFLPVQFFDSAMRMSADLFSGVLSWSQQHGVREITLLGGEPSLHPNFAEMVSLAHRTGLTVRVVTNGALSFRRALASNAIGAHNLGRVAISLDSLDEDVQDKLRGRKAWDDAMHTIKLLREHDVPFDINVTAVTSALEGLDALIDFGSQVGCRRVNIHWPSRMGIGSSQPSWQIPDKRTWQALTHKIGSRIEMQQGFFVEIERGFLGGEKSLTACALPDLSNLQILPDGRAYRCGLLVDRFDMASLLMVDGRLLLTQPNRGEEALRSSMTSSCDACPVMEPANRHACIFDKIRSISV